MVEKLLISLLQDAFHNVSVANQNMAAELDIPFLETSAKTRHNVEECFQTVLIKERCHVSLVCLMKEY